MKKGGPPPTLSPWYPGERILLGAELPVSQQISESLFLLPSCLSLRGPKGGPKAAAAPFTHPDLTLLDHGTVARGPPTCPSPTPSLLQLSLSGKFGAQTAGEARQWVGAGLGAPTLTVLPGRAHFTVSLT